MSRLVSTSVTTAPAKEQLKLQREYAAHANKLTPVQPAKVPTRGAYPSTRTTFGPIGPWATPIANSAWGPAGASKNVSRKTYTETKKANGKKGCRKCRG
jgi:hypothetical protein